TARNSRECEQGERDRRQGPAHAQTLLRPAGDARVDQAVRSVPAAEVEIVPSTEPSETVQVERTARGPAPAIEQVPVKPVSSTRLTVPSQVAPPGKRTWSALSETSPESSVRRSIRNAEPAGAVPVIERTPELLRSIAPLRSP